MLNDYHKDLSESNAAMVELYIEFRKNKKNRHKWTKQCYEFLNMCSKQEKQINEYDGHTAEFIRLHDGWKEQMNGWERKCKMHQDKSVKNQKQRDRWSDRCKLYEKKHCEQEYFHGFFDPTHPMWEEGSFFQSQTAAVRLREIGKAQRAQENFAEEAAKLQMYAGFLQGLRNSWEKELCVAQEEFICLLKEGEQLCASNVDLKKMLSDLSAENSNLCSTQNFLKEKFYELSSEHSRLFANQEQWLKKFHDFVIEFENTYNIRNQSQGNYSGLKAGYRCQYIAYKNFCGNAIEIESYLSSNELSEAQGVLREKLGQLEQEGVYLNSMISAQWKNSGVQEYVDSESSLLVDPRELHQFHFQPLQGAQVPDQDVDNTSTPTLLPSHTLEFSSASSVAVEECNELGVV